MPESEAKSDLHTTEKDTFRAAGAYQQEVEEQIANEAMGDGAATEPLRQGSLGRKESPDTVGANPKRTENSRPD